MFELWFGDGPAPVAREINRAIYFGSIAGPGGVSGEAHKRTLRMEGRSLAWTEDTGMRTVDYYPSVAYNHWVELDRLKEGRGYSAPADYIQLTEELYGFTRTESEFSGLMHMSLMDMNRLEQVGLRLGFNGAERTRILHVPRQGRMAGPARSVRESSAISAPIRSRWRTARRASGACTARSPPCPR